MNVLLLELGCDRPELNEPIGLASIAAAVASFCPAAKVEQRWEKVAPDFARGLEGFDVCGVSLQIQSLDKFRAFYSSWQALDRRPRLVLGNLIPTYATEQLLSEFPDVVCVISEGESAFSQIVAGQPLRTIPNLAFLEPGSGLVRTRPSQEILSRLPLPDRQLASVTADLGGIVRIEGSRGCHWGRCDFCSVASRFGLGSWRPFAIERIVADLIALSGLGVRSPYFSDEDFFGRDYERGLALADAILQAKKDGAIRHNMNFFISMLSSDLRVAACERALVALREAGLREVFLGVESGVEMQLQRYGKKGGADSNTRAIAATQRLGLQLDIGCIMFEPSMSMDELHANIDYLVRLNLPECDSRVVKALKIQPATQMESSLADRIVGPLDINTLTYPYGFEDSRVSACLRNFRDWAEETRDLTDRVMAKARGEVRSEDLRMRFKRSLARCRALDLNAVSAIAHGGGAVSKLTELTTQKRDVLREADANV